MSISSSRNGGHNSPHDRGRSVSPFAVVASTQFESGPPASKFKGSDEDPEIVETVQEEEWEERKKTTTTTTRNVERRVQRQLVLEDGELVDDTGPVITEDATEDTVTKEVVSDQNQRPEGQLALEPPSGEGWVATPGGVIISEKCTKTVKSHDEVEDEIETEEVQYCGDVTNKEAEDHLKGQTDLRELIAHRQNQGWALTKPQKRVVHEATRKKGNVDTVDVRETSKVQGGHVVTETERTVTQEQYDNESAPDSGSSLSDGSVHEAKKETSHNLVHTKDEDLLEYYAVPKGAPLAQGVKIGEGMHVVSEDVHEDRQGNEADEAVDRLKRRTRRPGRRDALTKTPLDYDQEEETRKSETNKWLEHHFGSESGRSEDSYQEDSADRIHSTGGNRITITMSPRPATNEDVPDAGSPVRRWPQDSTKVTSSTTPKAPPPPPPPKPERIWSTSAEPPTSPMSQQTTFPRHVHEIQDSELAAARSRLRSTGLNLMEENKENNAPESPVRGYSSSLGRIQTAEPKKNSPPGPPPSGTPPSGPPPSGPPQSKIASIKEDVIYSSKFRSGRPKKNVAPRTPYDAPPQLPVTPPPSITTVGRSQSFHIQTLPLSSPKKESPSKYKSSMKDYRSEERLDDIDSRRDYPTYATYNRKWREEGSHHEYRPRYHDQNKPSHVKTSWSPPREPTPPPPPRHSRKSPTTKSYSSASTLGREAATQTGPSPIPPPRTKRKKRPKNSYFFGQDNDSSSHSSSMLHNGPSYRHSGNEQLYNNDIKRERTYYHDQSYSSNRSPKVEKRYKTTKTITPVLVIPYEERMGNQRNKEYTSMNKSSWTNTVDPRRRPRISKEEERSTTLPRKLSSHNSSSAFPKKTYLFGEIDPSNGVHNSYANPHVERVHNISVNRSESQNEYNRFSSLNNRLNNRTGKPVGRSQSFNVQPGKNYPNNPISNGRHLSEISDQRTSTVYGSSPYVNLRSPNLIANIARTSSTRLNDYEDMTDSPERREPIENHKRDRFMKGLLTNAPELFHFIHGDESNESRTRSATTQRESTTTTTTRPTVDVSSSSYSPPTLTSPSYSARVFTFGKGDNNTLTRTTSQRLATDDEPHRNVRANYDTEEGRTFSTEENNRRNSSYNNNNNNSSNPNRRAAFNLKTSGGSLLYSPSFRNQQEHSERRGSSGGSSAGKDRLSGDFSRAAMSHGDNPVLIQIRDWNTR